MKTEENIHVIVHYDHLREITEVYVRDTLENARFKAQQEMNVLAVKNGSEWEEVKYCHWINQFGDWFRIFSRPVLSRRNDE